MSESQSDSKVSFKVVGTSGQISLGKEHAGRHVLVEEREPGVWLIRTARVIPDNEAALHTPDGQSSLLAALAWARDNPPVASDPDEVFSRLGIEQRA